MARTQRGRVLVLGVSLLALVGFGCTPQTTPPPPPTPQASTTPAESPQEREERLAYEAAEKSYRDFRAEFNRLLIAGGASKASAQMTRTAGSTYLKENLEVIQAYRGLDYHQEGTEEIVFVRRNGYSPTSILLSTCEDARGVSILSRKGKLIAKGDARLIELDVKLKDKSWKVWSGTGKKVASCDS